MDINQYGFYGNILVIFFKLSYIYCDVTQNLFNQSS